MMMKQTSVMICIVAIIVLSGCLRTETALRPVTSKTTTNRKAPQRSPQNNSERNRKNAEQAPGKDRLLEKGDFVFSAVTLEEFARTISKQFDMVVWIDEVALDEVGLGRDSKLTVNLEGVSLRAGLAGALTNLGLAYDYDIRESYLLISSDGRIECNPSARVYRLNGSVKQAALRNNIQTVIAPDSWEIVGGTGVLVSTVCGGLVITQTEEVHRQIVQTHGELLQPVDPGVARVPKAEWRALIAALAAKTKLEVKEVRLTEVLRELADEHQLKIVVDQARLDEFGLDAPSILVTANFKGLSWGTALKLILDPSGLTYMIDSDGEVLTITSLEGAENGSVPVMYKIDDLITNKSDYDLLVKTITSTIDPDSWEEVGGLGAIKTLPDVGLMTVLQTSSTHFKLAQLMADLRQLKK